MITVSGSAVEEARLVAFSPDAFEAVRARGAAAAG
jgi:hypothetical protein